MKILKIKVMNYPNGSMKYPDGFKSINCLDHLYYDDLTTGICWLIVVIKDEDLSKITDMANVTELTLLEATALLEEYEPKTEEITNEAVIRRLEIKTKAGILLTTDDLKAIDPHDNTPGICYRKRLIDRINMRLKI